MARMLTTAAAALLLLVTVKAITPEQMISAPRYSPPSPNPSGEWATFTSTNYSFKQHQSSTTWWLMRLSTGEVTHLPLSGDDVSEIVWVGPTNTSVLYVNGTNEAVPGGITLWTADVADTPLKSTMVAALAAPYSGLKAVTTNSGDINFVMSAMAYANNGSAYNEQLARTPHTTGRLYDSIYVRHWDTWITKERMAVFSGTLRKGYSGYSLGSNMTNLLKGMTYTVTRPESPVGPFFDSGDYEISPDGSQVVFLTKAPQLPKANYTASYLYLVPHDGSSVAKPINGPSSSAPEAAQGASGAPAFSPDGKKLAYLQQDGVSYESDRSKVYVADLQSKEITLVAGNWDRWVHSIAWSNDGQTFWVTADHIGSVRIFQIPVDANADYNPTNLTGITSVTAMSILPSGEALVSANAVWSSYLVYTISLNGTVSDYLFTSNSVDPELAGLSAADVGYFWYKGVNGDDQQAIIVYPENFDSSQVYDLAFYVHGGPQGYTGNIWSTRWNLKTWADQGYVVVGPNPTGSTSYGQNLTDNIQGRWGGWPYEDLVNAHAYTCENLKYVNCSNAVQAGASYGGYMTNWIQGHDLGRQFQALVCHDGIATTYSVYSTEELWFTQHDFNGTLWDGGGYGAYGAWDPLAHALNFSTPQFIIHSELDYRLPPSEGIAMFNVLQERGVPSRFLSFPDEGHWVMGRENSLFWHRNVFGWINYWTGKVAALSEADVIDM